MAVKKATEEPVCNGPVTVEARRMSGHRIGNRFIPMVSPRLESSVCDDVTLLGELVQDVDFAVLWSHLLWVFELLSLPNIKQDTFGRAALVSE
jgi:hypothetical protein